jgi:oxygen-independent coproporphyrinogen-3 oxidase
MLDLLPVTAASASHESPYQQYVYAYPHKTAYRPLRPRPRLRDVWRDERRDALFLYLHVPFCEMRCGFCNLFTRTGAAGDLVSAYLDALERQAEAVAEELGDACFVQAAFGGGTPTHLSAAELSRLWEIAERFAGARLVSMPVSVETSPATATADRLSVLAERGTTRVSIGVQSFLDTEARAVGRPQRRVQVEAALERIRRAGFPVLNIDLIYGIGGQTERSWLASLDAALAWAPEELYLYPLYVRPLTGLDGKRNPESVEEWDSRRLCLYVLGRDHLLAAGYEQVSMRMFRRADSPSASSATEYCCQTDGMVGLGCGARSYTRALHYSFDYAVGIAQVRAILDDYVCRPADDFRYAEVGYILDDAEARRRYLIQSLLQAEGVDLASYRERFGAGALDDFAGEFTRLAGQGWLEASQDRLWLTPKGLAHSDAIGPALFSSAVQAAMTGYERR